MKYLFITALLFSAGAFAQGPQTPVVAGPVTLGTPCIPGSPFYANLANGQMASCQLVSGSYVWSLVNAQAGQGQPGGVPPQIQFDNNGFFGGFTASGDCTINPLTGIVNCAGSSIVTNVKQAPFGAVNDESSFTGIIAPGSPVITGTSTTVLLKPGQTVAGPGIPAHSTILSTTSNTVTISANATAPSTTLITVPLTFTGTTTNGSNSVTGIASTAGLAPSQPLSGVGINTSPATFVNSVAANSITLSTNAIASGTVVITAATVVASFYGSLTSGSNSVNNIASTAGLSIGQAIIGAGIPASTTIASVGASSITMSNNATANSTNGILAGTDNTVALNTACEAAKTAGGPGANGNRLYIPAGRYLSDTLTCIGTGATATGLTIEGAGGNSTWLVSLSGNDVIAVNQAAVLHTLTIKNLGMDGNYGYNPPASTVCHPGGATSTIGCAGLNFTGAAGAFNLLAQNLWIQNVGAQCVYDPVSISIFDAVYDRIQCNSVNAHGIEIAGGNTTMISNSYAHSIGTACPATTYTTLGCAGFVVYGGHVTLLNDLGLDNITYAGVSQPIPNSTWAIFGNGSNIPWVTMINCNVEDFAKIGTFSVGGTIDFIDDSFFPYLGTVTEAMRFYGSNTGVNIINSGTTIASQSTSGPGGNGWDSGYAIHAQISCPAILGYNWAPLPTTTGSCYNEAQSFPYPNTQATLSVAAFHVTAVDFAPLSASKGIYTTAIRNNGTNFTATGCSVSGLLGGSSGGRFVAGVSGACNVSITLPSGIATNGWSCWINDLTTPANVFHQTAGSTLTLATMSGTSVSGDAMNFGCMAY